MGDKEIKITSISNEDLRALAGKADKDKNGTLKGKEIEIFSHSAAEHVKNGTVPQEEFESILGYTKIDLSQKSEAVLRYAKDISKSNVALKDFASEIKEKIEFDNDNELDADYKKLIGYVDTIFSKIPAFNSQKDVEKIEKTVKQAIGDSEWKKMNEGGFASKLLDTIVDKAEKEQQDKEFAEVKAYYEGLVEKDGEHRKNPEHYFKATREHFKDKGSYYKEQVALVGIKKKTDKARLKKEVVRQDAKEVARDVIDDAESIERKDTKRETKSALKDAGVWDKFTRKAFKSEDVRGERQAKTAENRVEAYQIRSIDDIYHDLGEDKVLSKKQHGELLTAMERKGLVKDLGGGQYDITKLQEIILNVVGEDYELTRHNKDIDTVIAELTQAFATLSSDIGMRLTDKEVKQIVKMCGFDVEGTDWKKVIAGTALGLLAGAVAGLATQATTHGSTLKINKQNHTELYLKGISADDVNIDQAQLDALKANGAEITITQMADGIKLVIDLTKKKVIEGALGVFDPLGIIAPALLGALLGAIGAADDKGEKAVIPTQFSNEKDFAKWAEEYQLAAEKAKIPQEYTQLFIMLASTYKYSDGSFNPEGFKQDLNRIAGDGGKLNAKEVRSNKMQAWIEERRHMELPDKYQTKVVEKYVEVPVPVPTIPKSVGELAELPREDYEALLKLVQIREEGSFKYHVTDGDRWRLLIDAFYPDWKSEGLKEADVIRALKNYLKINLSERRMPKIINFPPELQVGKTGLKVDVTGIPKKSKGDDLGGPDGDIGEVGEVIEGGTTYKATISQSGKDDVSAESADKDKAISNAEQKAGVTISDAKKREAEFLMNENNK